METPLALFSDWPTEERVTPLVPIAERVRSGDVSAVRELFDRTGKVIGWLDVHQAESGSGVRSLVEWCLAPPLPARGSLSERELRALVRLVGAAKLPAPQHDYALAVLQHELDQMYVIDLLYWPRAPLDDSEFLRVARNVKGARLAEYLAPQCSPEDPGTMPEPPGEAAKAFARGLIVRLLEHGLIELSCGEQTVTDLATWLPGTDVQAGALAEWLVDCKSLGEVFGDDASIAAVLDETRAG